jgi:hypothetical protein
LGTITIKKEKIMKKLKNYLTLAICCFLSFSCIVDDEIDTDNELFNGPLVVGFKDAETLGNFVEETGAVFPFDIPVHLIGGASGQPSNSTITMSYEIGTFADLDLSDEKLAELNEMLDVNNTPMDPSDDVRKFPIAELGTHFNWVDSNLESTIPATSTFDLIPIAVNNDALDNAKTTVFVLNLKTVVSSDNVVISEQLESTLVKLQLCRTDLAGTYTLNDTAGILGPGTYTITHLGAGNYELSSMFGWSTSGYTSYFYACAGQLIFTEWVFSNEIIQGSPGFVNSMGQLVFPEFGIGRPDGPPVYSGANIILTLQ